MTAEFCTSSRYFLKSLSDMVFLLEADFYSSLISRPFFSGVAGTDGLRGVGGFDDFFSDLTAAAVAYYLAAGAEALLAGVLFDGYSFLV